MTLDEQIAEKEAAGFEIVQEGRVLYPARTGLSFSDRVEGFDIRLLAGGRDKQFRHALLDDASRWVHMRKPISKEEDDGSSTS